MLFYGAARIVRYGLLAWLGITYGRHIVRIWEHSLDGWSTRILWIYGGLVMIGILYGLWKYKHRASNDSSAPAQEMA
jgi:hypothetical protein